MIWLASIFVIGCGAYLVYALLFPEKL
ncbi:potassium-transporting ATPase subunit F [Seleniivibrio woodruffii]